MVMGFKEDNGEKWPQYWAATTVAIASFANALHIGWPSPFLPKLLSDDYPFDVSNDEASYITIIASVGNICGGFLATSMIDIMGRKPTILLIALPQIAGFTSILLSSYAVELLYIGRFVGGLAEGACLTVMPIYVAEIAEPQIRGILGSSLALSFIMGMVFINLLGSYVSIEMAAGISLIFPVLFVILFWKMPESPYYLLMKNREEEAAESLRFLRRQTNVTAELNRLHSDVTRQMSEPGGYLDVFTIRTNRIAVFLVMGARLAQQLTGATAFGFYAQILIKQATNSMDPALASTALLLVQLVMTTCSIFFIDRYGRKILLMTSFALCSVDLSLQTVFYFLKEYTAIDLDFLDSLPLFLMVGFIAFFACGAAVAVNVLQSEFFSNSIKPKAVAIANIVFAGGMMSTTKFYQATADSFGLTVPFFTFTVCTVLGLVFFWLFLPETKGKSLEEIQQMLAKGRKEYRKSNGSSKM